LQSFSASVGFPFTGSFPEKSEAVIFTQKEIYRWRDDYLVPVLGMSPTMDQRLAARECPPGIPVMRQRWAGLLFLHWPIDPALIEKRLPPGLHVDTYEGKAWLGVVPFFMQRVRPTGLPPLPWLSWFHELNVRTYVFDKEGNPGVWFFSLDCNQPLAVEIARRAFHLPYEHAAMRSSKSAGRIGYTSQRKSIGAIGADYEYDTPIITQAAASGSFEWFLVERYLLFSSNPSGKLFCGRVHHAPYQIAAGVCSRWSTEPLRLDGFPEPAEPPSSVLTAASVDVKIFPLRLLKK
jgi:uncharacterized protein YqjF (DUF2071 family)